jgi:CDP-diacylglycerol--glycerol-3-phosphate 3-phosphatidyltransferase
LAGGFFDLVDGVVARHRGISTTFGGFLDSTLDRFVDVVLFVGLLVFYAGQGDALTALAVSLGLVASVLTSYAKARADQVIGNLRGGLLERGERIGLLAAGAVLGFMPLALWLLALGGSITVAQRFSIAYREMEALDAARSSSES